MSDVNQQEAQIKSRLKREIDLESHVVEIHTIEQSRLNEMQRLLFEHKCVFVDEVLTAVSNEYSSRRFLIAHIDPYNKVKHRDCGEIRISRPMNAYLLYRLALMPLMLEAKAHIDDNYKSDFTPEYIAALSSVLWETEDSDVKYAFHKLHDVEARKFALAFPSYYRLS
ncbi:hypothetical protein V1512DRAFT_278387 [Lipomyces arxii]|uniref:uncharacterized protein n=1 Tax=Lipomyces arxii TaxID=56418 RepID=UPI0034CDD163